MTTKNCFHMLFYACDLLKYGDAILRAIFCFVMVMKIFAEKQTDHVLETYFVAL